MNLTACCPQAFRDAEVVRSRVPDVLAELDAVIDVGGVYEPGACALRSALAAVCTRH